MKRFLMTILVLVSLAACTKIENDKKVELETENNSCRKMNQHLLDVIHGYRQLERDKLERYQWPEMDEGINPLMKCRIF